VTTGENGSRFAGIQPGDALPGREFQPDNVQSMLYNAVLWNAHRIHFDEPYATGVEGYPGLVVPGPLLGDWLNQCVDEWLDGDGRLVAIEYSNRVATYVGEKLYSGGRVIACRPDSAEVEIEVFIRNGEGVVVAPGVARARFDRV
jgi:hydroxyacyl-ACP dehydratase HTD2-like protein with hotdog domain